MSRRKYVYRWWDGPHYRQQTFDRKCDRDDFVSELRRRRQTGGLVDIRSDVTLDAWVEEWWVLHAIPNLEQQSRDGYLQQWEKHLRPRLGSYRLRELNATVIGRLRADLERAGVGAPTIRKALAVLQSILTLAVDQGRLTVNPASQIRKPSQAPTRQLEPVRPLLVERMRARLELRDATMLSLLGYVGLRPQELLAFHVEDLVDGKLLVNRKNVDGQVLPYTKTRKHRTLTLYASPLQDLREYLVATGIRRGLVFPTARGSAWRTHDWNNWRGRLYQPLARSVGLESPVPYDLRASSVSLRAWEGETMLEVARYHGHGVQVCETHYARCFAEVPHTERRDAPLAIRAARDAVHRERHGSLFDASELSG